jgi:hypothetical protein
VVPERKLSGESLKNFQAMTAELEDAGCLAATGEHCPI